MFCDKVSACCRITGLATDKEEVWKEDKCFTAWRK